MDCEQIQELISGMLDGELSNTDRALVNEHMEHCPECRAVFEAFSAVSDSLHDLEEVPEGLTDAVMDRVRAKPKAPKRRRLAGFAAMAACLALVLLAGRGLFPLQAKSDAALSEQDMNNAAPMMSADTADDGAAEPEAQLLGYDSAVLVQNSISGGTEAEETPSVEADEPDPEYSGAGGTQEARYKSTVNGAVSNSVNVDSLDVILAIAAPAEYGEYEGVSDYTVVFYSGDETHTLDVWVDGEQLYCQDDASSTAYYAEGTYAQLLSLIEE